MSTAPHIRLLLLVSVLSFVSTGASASTFIITEDELEADIFPLVAESILQNLDGSNAPPGLTSAQRKQVINALERMDRYIAEDPDRYAHRIKTLQIRVNSVLAPQVARDDNDAEVVCRRIKRAGTHIPETQCRTRAEMENDKHLANEMIRQLRDQDGQNRPSQDRRRLNASGQ